MAALEQESGQRLLLKLPSQGKGLHSLLGTRTWQMTFGNRTVAWKGTWLSLNFTSYCIALFHYSI